MECANKCNMKETSQFADGTDPDLSKLKTRLLRYASETFSPVGYFNEVSSHLGSSLGTDKPSLVKSVKILNLHL